MKELAKSINTSFFERIKNPLLGSFFLAYLSVNHKGIIAYYYALPADKVKIVNQFNFYDWGDICRTLAIVGGYIVLNQFVLPLFQLGIDKLKLLCIDKPRFKQRTKLDLADYDSQALVSISKFKSSEEYIADLAAKNLLNWVKERDELNMQLKSVKSDLDMKSDKLLLVEKKYKAVDSFAKNHLKLISTFDDLLVRIISGLDDKNRSDLRRYLNQLDRETKNSLLYLDYRAFASFTEALKND